MTNRPGRIGIKCPVDGAGVDDATCLSCRLGAPRAGSHCSFPYEVLKAMMDESGRETAYISATMLGGVCLRQTWLQQRHPYHVDPDRYWAALRGSIGHQLVEQYSEPDAIIERRFETEIDGRRFTGQIDKFHPERRIITDFKTKAEGKKPPTEPQPEHVMQLNVYRWLLWHGWPQQPIKQGRSTRYKPGTPARIEIDHLELVYWTFGWVARLEVPLLPFEEVQAYIESRIALLTGETPPPVPDDLDPAGLNGRASVFCERWCPVRAACLRQLREELADDDVAF